MKLASSILIVAVILTIAKLAMAFDPAVEAVPKALDPRYDKITTYLFCMSDDMSTEVTLEKDLSSISYGSSLFEIDFSKADSDVEIKEATDLGFSVRKRSTGALLVFRERALDKDDMGVDVKYHLQGVAEKPVIPKTKSGTKMMEALARIKLAKIDKVIKCREIPHN